MGQTSSKPAAAAAATTTTTTTTTTATILTTEKTDTTITNSDGKSSTATQDGDLTSTSTTTAELTAPKREYGENLYHIDVGIWRVLFDKTPAPALSIFTDLFKDAPTVTRLLKDTFRMGPKLMVLMVFVRIWSSIKPLLLLSLSNKLLGIIEIGIRHGKPQSREIIRALCIRMVAEALIALMRKWSSWGELVLQNRMKMHFEDYILQAKLKQGLQGGGEDDREQYVSAGTAWRTLDTLFDVGERVLDIISQLSFLLHIVTSKRAPIFALCCAAQPLFKAWAEPSIWDKAHIQDLNNDDYRRLRAINKFGDASHREEVITGNLSDYVLSEMRRVTRNLYGIPVEYAYEMMDSQRPAIVPMVSAMLEAMPFAYYSIQAIFFPKELSLASIATLQQSSSMVRSSVDYIQYYARRYTSQVSDMKRLYALEKVQSPIQDGHLPYPDPAVLVEGSPRYKGMEFKLEDVSFTYPGSKTVEPALKNLNCTIGAGQMVVIVGANGSGKSTIIKLLNRLYAPSSGRILVDEQPIETYLLSDFRQASTTLTQDHSLFPVSLGENVGIGWTEQIGNMELIDRAIQQGGAEEVVKKMKDGLATSLVPERYAWGVHVSEHDDSPLGRELKAREKEIRVSGGEKQRLVASRAFMRFESGEVRFVTVDEPSSAMDPEAEFQLFRNLRSKGEGKTMIFVTHRFGHLTKHADQILCMKEGTIVENGSHDELIALDGEYAKLYKIQAEAFEKPSEKTEASGSDENGESKAEE